MVSGRACFYLQPSSREMVPDTFSPSLRNHYYQRLPQRMSKLSLTRGLRQIIFKEYREGSTVPQNMLSRQRRAIYELIDE